MRVNNISKSVMPVIFVNRLSIVYNAVTWCTKNKEISIIYFFARKERISNIHPKKYFSNDKNQFLAWRKNFLYLPKKPIFQTKLLTQKISYKTIFQAKKFLYLSKHFLYLSKNNYFLQSTSTEYSCFIYYVRKSQQINKSVIVCWDLCMKTLLI